MKKIIKIFFVLALICSVCSCGKELEKEQDITKITFSFWEPGMAHELEDALQKVADDYEKLKPDVKIELISQPVESYQDWIKTCIIADEMPDIQSNHDSVLSAQYNAGLIINIADKLNSSSPYSDGKIWKDTFQDEHMNHGLENIVMPFFGTGLCIFYNKSIYEKLGLSVPHTWKEFVSNCEVIQNSGMLPIAFMAQKNDACQWIEWEIAGGLFAKKHLSNKNININHDRAISYYEIYRAILLGEVDFANDKEYQYEYREYVKRLEEILQYCEGYPGLEESVAKAMFLSGEAAHIFSGSWDIKGIMKNDSVNFGVGIFKFPVFTQEETPYYGEELRNLSHQSIAVTKTAYNEEGRFEKVIDFLQYLTSKDVYQGFINDTAQIPVIKDIEYPEETELFSVDGYAYDLLLIDNENAEIIHSILAGKQPVLDSEYFKKLQETLKSNALKYIEEHKLSSDTGYYMKEIEDGRYDSEG